MTRTGQPAMRAGTASMIAVEGSGAVPAGTYRPTASSGTIMRSQTTPGAVSRRSGASVCASWKRVTVSIARVERGVLLRRQRRLAPRRIPRASLRTMSS